MSVCLADGLKLQSCGFVCVPVTLVRSVLHVRFEILPCDVEGILGMPFLTEINPMIDWALRTVKIAGEYVPTVENNLG